MRRSDREITDPDRIREILTSCRHCRLGLADGRSAYIVPLNFGFTEADGYLYPLFPRSQGRQKAGADQTEPLRRIWNGYEFFTDWGRNCLQLFRPVPEHHRRGRCLHSGRCRRKETGAYRNHETSDRQGRLDFPDKMIAATCVFQLRVEQLSCKEHK